MEHMKDWVGYREDKVKRHRMDIIRVAERKEKKR